jgi:hypothetical protein
VPSSSKTKPKPKGLTAKQKKILQDEIDRTCAAKAKLPKNASLPLKEQLGKDVKVPCYLTGKANGLRVALKLLG